MTKKRILLLVAILFVVAFGIVWRPTVRVSAAFPNIIVNKVVLQWGRDAEGILGNYGSAPGTPVKVELVGVVYPYRQYIGDDGTMPADFVPCKYGEMYLLVDARFWAIRLTPNIRISLETHCEY